ncbi:chemotaxis protein CheB [Endozoicomonas sp. ONNA2]|uniref:chemotaxis protein CheB n=1 Tax=Endozoicomonas sp. ONNA2 TaxID=2828741 RepID=UPI002148F50A|nr:chemotaxis protein CheB [Endozoicomonas sp. ONNA2]
MSSVAVEKKPRAVVLGASAGGINALGFLFSELREDFSLPILVTKHVGLNDDRGMLRVLARQSVLPVRVAKDKYRIQAGAIYLAPADYHMLVEGQGVISLNLEEPVAHSRPSIDVLFQSAARVYGQELVAVVLTGANRDGADGIRTVKHFGGTTVAQCPENAEIGLMPRASLDTGCVDYLMTLEEISAFLDQIGA